MASHLRTLFVVLFYVVALPVVAADEFKTTVWTSGEGAYHTYRIPSVIQTMDGTLLAFCEGRRSGRGDAGNIDFPGITPLIHRRKEPHGSQLGRKR